jgi:hypothetical protein
VGYCANAAGEAERQPASNPNPMQIFADCMNVCLILDIVNGSFFNYPLNKACQDHPDAHWRDADPKQLRILTLAL